ncbi:hypothetical protein R3P38DRAFT_2804165 [Favolaschia claudopus]|uniref:DUF6534 domain-containing protein n=1 Tax=Favolaschia claudopus TaxID=2862362 RepID=A0AAV9ZRC9_9AGAR
MATPSFTPPPLDNTLGAGYIGVFVSSAYAVQAFSWDAPAQFFCRLYGLTCLQTYNYFNQQATKKDPIFLKSCVICLWVVETLHSACIAHAMYFYSVSHFGNYLTLTTAVWSIILPVGLTSRGIHSQLHRMENLPINIQLLRMACLYYSSQAVSDKNKPIVFLICGRAESTHTLGTGWGPRYKLVDELCGHGFTDRGIAVLLFTYQEKRYQEHRHVDSEVDYLRPQLWCSVQFLTMPNNLVNYALNWILGKVYSNSLLSTLNARSHLRETRGGAGAIALDLVESKPSFSPHQPSGVTVTTVTESTSATQVGKFGASESEFKMQEF